MTEAKTAPKKAPGSSYGAKTFTQALASFQADLPEVGLDALNPHFKSKYASLSNITKKVFPKLAEHGFAFSVGSFVDNGVLILDAHLIHESGESRSAQFPITETNSQKVGSAVTYYRRYALAALTGIVADEDDDGNVASQPTATERKLDQARNAPRPVTPQTSDHPAQAKVREWIGGDPAKKEQANTAYENHKKTGLSGADLWQAVADEVLG